MRCPAFITRAYLAFRSFLRPSVTLVDVVPPPAPSEPMRPPPFDFDQECDFADSGGESLTPTVRDSVRAKAQVPGPPKPPSPFPPPRRKVVR